MAGVSVDCFRSRGLDTTVCGFGAGTGADVLSFGGALVDVATCWTSKASYIVKHHQNSQGPLAKSDEGVAAGDGLAVAAAGLAPRFFFASSTSAFHLEMMVLDSS